MPSASCSSSRCRGVPAPYGVFEIKARRIEVFWLLPREEIGAAILEWLAFFDDGVSAIGELDAPRRAVAITRWNPVRPRLRQRFEMTVGGKITILARHGILLRGIVLWLFRLLYG